MNSEKFSVDQIIQRMSEVRDSGQASVRNIQHEAKRLVDWKEHVKARPLTAVSLCSLAGFLFVHKFAKVRHSRFPSSAPDSTSKETFGASVAIPRTSWMNPLIQSTREVVIAGAKNALLTAVKKFLVEGLSHDRLSSRTRIPDSANSPCRSNHDECWLD